MLRMGDWLHPPPPSTNTAIVATSLNSQVFFFLRSVWQVELLTRFLAGEEGWSPLKQQLLNPRLLFRAGVPYWLGP
jgi:hypothetical protein